MRPLFAVLQQSCNRSAGSTAVIAARSRMSKPRPTTSRSFSKRFFSPAASIAITRQKIFAGALDRDLVDDILQDVASRLAMPRGPKESPALRVSREEPRELLALDCAERLCAIRGSYKSHPLRFSESSGEALGTSRVVGVISSPARRKITTSPSSRKVSNNARGGGRGAFAEGTPVTMAQRSAFV